MGRMAYLCDCSGGICFVAGRVVHSKEESSITKSVGYGLMKITGALLSAYENGIEAVFKTLLVGRGRVER